MITFKHFLEIQSNEIQKYKLIESEKAGHDLGVSAEIKWVENNASQFRKDVIEKYEVII